MKPSVYIATGQSQDVRRKAPEGARCAVHFPDLGRTIELWVDGEGRWALDSLPAPGRGGERYGIARGLLANEGEKVRVYPSFNERTLGEQSR
jgi:hypothetical protein